MQTKNKIFLTLFLVLNLFSIFSEVNADEFNIVAKEIAIDKKNNIIVGTGSVEVTDKEGKFIRAEKVTYEKSIEFLKVENSVEFFDEEGNLIKTDKATYDKLKDIIISYQNSELILKEGYKLVSNNILYNNKKKIVSSDRNSILTDSDGNKVEMSMFQYSLEEKIFSSVGKIKITDVKKNKYFFKELHVDTEKKEMIGSDASVVFDQENFGLTEENDPRLVANDIYLTKNNTNLSKGVFTVCKERKDKCPPWSLQAKKINHDKLKKTIYYESATLKVYDFPIFYFPRFFHPDPSVKRQSGFLTPFFSDSTSVGTGFGLPYFWAISDDKDITFTPKFYQSESLLFLNEYRQAFKSGFLTLDTSFTQGYKNTTSTKTAGSRNHIFSKLDLDFAKNKDYESDLSVNIQKTSNDTYFRVHDINTSLVQSENTDLRNEINYKFAKNNSYINISGAIYENLRDNSNSRYEYIVPNLLFGKLFFTERYGSIEVKSNALYKNYKTNNHIASLTNDIIWNSNSYITQRGFVNSLVGMVKNTNYEAKNTPDYKTKGTINELTSVFSFKSSLPMKKDSRKYSNIFSPNFMLRYAPGHMRNLSGDDTKLKYSNLFSTNKTKEIEKGISTVLGFDYKINSKIENKEKLSVSLGQVFNLDKNKDMPSKSSLDQRMSDIVGEIGYNFSKIGKIDYKFSMDHNLNDLNYNEVSTSLNFGTVGFNLDYLEEQNHVGDEHYVNAGISLNLTSNSSFNFETKKNFKTKSTELYDISYQYSIDCLKAGLVYRREFYEDSDVEKNDTLMFKITFIPFGGVKTPSFINP